MLSDSEKETIGIDYFNVIGDIQSPISTFHFFSFANLLIIIKTGNERLNSRCL